MIARIARVFGYVPATPAIPAPGVVTEDRYQRAKVTIRSMLADTCYTWRKLDTLCRKAGVSEQTAKSILSDIGARGSRDNDTRTFPIYRLR